MESSTLSTPESHSDTLAASAKLMLRRGGSAVSSYEVVQDQVMNWFRGKGIKGANPEDIWHQHTQRLRQNTREQLGELPMRKIRSDLSERRKIRTSLTLRL